MADPALYEKSEDAQPYGGGTLFGDRNQRWATTQHELGVDAYLSPSYYVMDGRDDLLDRALFEGERFCDQVDGAVAYVVLALDAAWLRSAGDLADRVASSRYPIALALGDEYNPLRSRVRVQGLQHLLASCPRTFMLRCDVACLGALAHGAGGASYGTSTGVRHVWPPGRRSTGGPKGGSAVLVPALLRHVPVAKVEQLPDVDGVLRCDVERCTMFVDRFARPQYTDTDLVCHDLHVGRGLADEVVHGRVPAVDWSERCQRAIDLHRKISGPGGIDLRTPSHLRAWLSDG